MASSAEAWMKAAEYAARAAEAPDEEARIQYHKQRESWIRVARNCEFMEAVESNRNALPLAGW